MADLSEHGTEIYRLRREDPLAENPDGTPIQRVIERVLMSDNVVLEEIKLDGVGQGWNVVSEFGPDFDSEDWRVHHSKAGFVEA